MSVKKLLSFNKGVLSSSSSLRKQGSTSTGGSKRRRANSCFSFQEISIERSEKETLKDVNSEELKGKIVRWAKAVVAYARQVSGKIGSSRGDGLNGKSQSREYEEDSSR